MPEKGTDFRQFRARVLHRSNAREDFLNSA
jgi:hypothetical protein